MTTPVSAKRYRVKFADFYLVVDIDRSFSAVDQKTPKKSPPNTPESFHYHALHELFLVGNDPLCIFTAEGIFEYTNCFVCVPPFFRHYSFRKTDHRILFSLEKNECTSSDLYFFFEELFSCGCPTKIQVSASLDAYIDELARLISSKSDISNEVAIALFKVIFYNIYISNVKIPLKERSTANNSYVIEIEGIINNFQNDINLKTVADRLCLSTKQTSRIIMKNFKKPLAQLVNEKRLHVAKFLLTGTNYTITEIVEYVNFPSESYFYAQFKKAFGETPAKYKKRIKADETANGKEMPCSTHLKTIP